MKKLGKRFDGVKDTIQANDCGCLCGGCSWCYCGIWGDAVGANNSISGGYYDAGNFAARASAPNYSK
jgi:putative bacteriocin precursor